MASTHVLPRDEGAREADEGAQPQRSDLGLTMLAPPVQGAALPHVAQDPVSPPAEPANTVAAHNNGGEDAMSTEYLTYLTTLQATWTDCPRVEIVFKDLAFTIHNAATVADARAANARHRRTAAGATGAVPTKADENIPNLLKATWTIAKSPFTISHALYNKLAHVAPEEGSVLQALAPCSGVIRPGSMTLILAPPGAGKSTLLRAISGRLDNESGLHGTLLYNGLTSAECLARGIHVKRFCSYVGQSDVSFPVLTVAETLEFARNNGVADVSLLRKDGQPNAELEAKDAARTQLLMDLLGLDECADTYIGNDLLRGISGGQKTRVKIGESLMSNARLYALDEVSNGLDSAVTLHIFTALRQACAINGTAVVTALQQVTPETYALFDDVILMREGHVLYHGPRTEVAAWMRDVMDVPFVPQNVEEAGFVVELLSDPATAMQKAALAHKVDLAQKAAQAHGGASPMALPEPVPKHRRSEDDSDSEAGDDDEEEEQTPPAEASNVPVANGDAASSPTQATAVEQQKQREPSRSANQVIFHMGPDESEPPVTDAVSSPPAAKKTAAPAPLRAKPSARGLVPLDKDGNPAPFYRTKEQLEMLNVDELAAAAAESTYTKRVEADVSARWAARESLAAERMDLANWGPFTRSQYARSFPHSSAYHTLLSCQRQSKLLGRNLTMVIPRMFNAILIGFVYGTLFFQLPDDDYSSRFGLTLQAVMVMAFANFQELPVAAEARHVVVRQVDAGFYPAFSYTVAVNLLTVPLAMMETIIFGTMIYFISGFVYEAGRYFFWLLILFTTSSAMSQMFRFITYVSGSPDVAQQLNLPFILLFVVFGGFLIPRVSVPDWLIWAYYLSPFSWATTALALNEFNAHKYQSVADVDDPTISKGDAYLEAFGMRTEFVWKWVPLAYLWGFYAFLSLCSVFVLNHLRPSVAMGAKRPHRIHKHGAHALRQNAAGSVAIEMAGMNGQATNPNHAAVSNGHVANGAANGAVSDVDAGVRKRLASARSSAKQSFQLTTMPFTPASLAWKNLRYTVYIGKEQTPKVLLNNISGFAEPGKLTALMGASGAGKTTLMDVLAGRKTTGLIEHESNIFVNGKPKDATFEHVTGYVEQTDLHNGQSTVREALEFSAKLRLPASVDEATRTAFVEEVMALVGLTHFQNRMVGDVSQPSLSTGQLKLLTIAVELVANPSILFLDEPTTGLDAKSAYRVMQAVRRIAATGRTCIVTIHQPSQEVFFMFDRLLLLRRGGETVYFDDLGTNGSKIVSYLTRVSRNVIPYSPLVSPANWMLDVVSLDATQLIEEQKQEEEQRRQEEEQRKQKALKRSRSSAAGSTASAKGAVPAAAPAPAAAVAAPSSPKSVADTFRQKVLQARQSSAFASFHEAPTEEQMQPIQFSEEWARSDENQRQLPTLERLTTPHAGSEAVAANSHVSYVSSGVRLYEVVKRSYVSWWRSPPINVTRCILMLISGIFIGVIYLDVSANDFPGLNSLLSAVFLGVSLPSSICSNASLNPFFRQRAVYYRENSVKMYGYLIYTSAMTLVEIPYLFLGTICFLIPFYFMIGLQNDGGLFFQFLLAAYLMVLFFHSMKQVFVAALPNMIVANALNGLCMSLLFTFGGLYIKASSIPRGWKWFYYVDPIPKAFIATMLTQLRCGDNDVDEGGSFDGCRGIRVPGMSGPQQSYAYASDLLEGSTSDYWPMIGWLCLTVGCLRLLSVVMFKYISHIKR